MRILVWVLASSIVNSMLCPRLGYEKDLFGILTQLVRDMDRKIERQKDRAAKESAPRPATATEQATLDAIKVPSGPT